MQKVHVIFWGYYKLASVSENVAVFKARFQSEKEFPFHRTELRAETEAKHTVLISGKPLFVNNTTIPEVTFPKVIFPPVVAHLAIQLHGIAVGQRMFIADRGVQRGGELEACIYREFGILCLFLWS